MDNLIVLAPGPGTAVSISGTSTAAQNLGSGTVRVAIKCTSKTHVVFGEAGVDAATTNDYPLNADTDYVFDVSPGRQYFRAIRAASDGTLIWAKVG